MEPHNIAIVPLGKKPLVPIRQDAGKGPELVGVLWKRESCFPCKKSNPNNSVIQPTHWTTFQLNYPSSMKTWKREYH